MKICQGNCRQGRDQCNADCPEELTTAEMVLVTVVESICSVVFLAVLFGMAFALAEHLTGSPLW